MASVLKWIDIIIAKDKQTCCLCIGKDIRDKRKEQMDEDMLASYLYSCQCVCS